MTTTNFINWFETFLDEKNLPAKTWEITDSTGGWNMIDSEVVIEAIKSCGAGEQAQIKNTIVKIDFHNGDVNHFFEHLAKGLIETRIANS